MSDLKHKLLDQHQQKQKGELDNLQKQHEQNLKAFKEELLEKSGTNEREKLDELQKKHEKEMNELKQKLGT